MLHLSTSYALVLLAALCVCACEEPLSVDGELPTQLNIESELRASESPTVRVSARTTLGEVVSARGLDNSFVSLTTRSGAPFDFEVVEANDSFAVFAAADDQPVLAGLSYRLTVNAPGYAELRSTTTVPLVFSAGREADTVQATRAPSGQEEFVSVPFRLTDAPATDNYYHLIVSIRESRGTADAEEGQRLSFRYTASPLGSVNAGRAGVLFTDETFADGGLDGSLLLDAGRVNALADPVVEVEVRNVSAAYYDSFVVQSAAVTSPLPGGGSTGVPNISGGSGYFTSYSSSLSVLRLVF